MSLYCPHMRYRKGTRTYSAYVPSYAQGAFFPGDEPGEYCRICDELCENVDGENPAKCIVQKKSNILCKNCEVHMFENGAEQIYCPECLEIYESEY